MSKPSEDTLDGSSPVRIALPRWAARGVVGALLAASAAGGVVGGKRLARHSEAEPPAAPPIALSSPNAASREEVAALRGQVDADRAATAATNEKLMDVLTQLKIGQAQMTEQIAGLRRDMDTRAAERAARSSFGR